MIRKCRLGRTIGDWVRPLELHWDYGNGINTGYQARLVTFNKSPIHGAADKIIPFRTLKVIAEFSKDGFRRREQRTLRATYSTVDKSSDGE